MCKPHSLTPCKASDSAVDTLNLFIKHIFKLQELPDSIVFDREPECTATFCSQLAKWCGIRLQLGISHHGQTEGSFKIMIRLTEKYLCYYIFKTGNGGGGPFIAASQH